MSVLFQDDLPHIVLNVRTRNPIQLNDFVSTFSSLASQYEKFVQDEVPALSDDANIFVREVRAGSIEADLIPWAMSGLSSVVNVIQQIDHCKVCSYIRSFAFDVP